MSVQAITWALDYAAGSVTEKVLLLVLANYANEFGVSWPSQKTLADQTALGERTVRRVLADMERRGVIRRIVRRRGNGSRQSDMILLAAFDGRKPAPPGMLDDGPDGAEIDASDQPANGDNRPTRPLDNRPPDPDPPATVAALDTSKILKRTTTARDVPARVSSEPVSDQGAAPAADAEAACLAACGPGLSASARIAIVTTRPVIADWLAAGYDLTADILPTLADRTKQARTDPIRTWSYFTQAIAKCHAQRIALAARAKSAGETGTVATASAPINPQDVLKRTAEWLNSGRFVPPSAVNNTTRDALLQAGLVTEATLRAHQIY
ncbi:Helix-turn-helix domain-containing protein [Pseudorhodobacter antarcticus]|uniref:Helix-turn-helix domain-containing protein n=1 Tax=Pseudorhodobacter antarcticus TaxID=1077947 RepID=A0A1H8LWD2_9RHOB|nr:helix-turn-helix domain-containing protein [Pseudorhodobacter antarcticus]SEO09340.1 Helix-turn-helix domain-containing protein [Pseudorhodobacter antarcticus]